jgi:hypothetical protein
MLAAATLLLGGCTRENPPPSTPFPNAMQSGQVDDFGLPLVIVINPPAVPKEIEGPLPPVKEEPPKPSPLAPLPKGEGTKNSAPPPNGEGTKNSAPPAKSAGKTNTGRIGK